MPYQDIEDSRIYQRAERLADVIWNAVIEWSSFARETVGQQLTRAVDSIGANIAKSAGRFHPRDVISFLYYARGSMRETRYWLKRARQRNLIANPFMSEQMAELDALGAEINSYINFQRTRAHEPFGEYDVSSADNEPTNYPAN